MLLKTNILVEKMNRSLDRLAYYSVKDVRPDYIQNTRRIGLNIGRMEPEERR
jgi:hypothetical protein